MALTTKQVLGKAVILSREHKGTGRRIGKVRRSVFHPTEKRVIGFIVKRPDVAWMFHRSDLFVALDSSTLGDEGLIVTGDEAAQGARALKRLGLDWDLCLLWEGMELVTEDGQSMGTVANVVFDEQSGEVERVEVDQGASARALLGKTSLDPSLIRGFRWRARLPHTALVRDGDAGEDASLPSAVQTERARLHQSKPEDADWVGVIMVADEALAVEPEGGVAEAAGRASAIAVQKGKEAAASLKQGVNTGVEKAKPAMDKVVHKTEEFISKGAYVTGRQLGRSTTMFSEFMDAYRRAAHGDDTDESNP